MLGPCRLLQGLCGKAAVMNRQRFNARVEGECHHQIVDLSKLV